MKTFIYKKLFYGALILGLFTSCAQAKEYSVSEIYAKMCSQCHGMQAQGNPEKKGPSLNDMSKHELTYELYELLGNGSQSSGSNHDIMEHNQRKIVEKGMTYHPDDMALYIYKTFGIDKDKKGISKQEKKVYSIPEIYTKTCLKCHGASAEGVPEKKGPAINDMTQSELEMELINLQSEGFQSSGTSSELMTHNQKKIEEKGLQYHPEDMARYIFYKFNPDAKK